MGKNAGFGGVILHGLASYGMTARAIINSVAGGDPNALKAIKSRFTSPVRLGGKSNPHVSAGVLIKSMVAFVPFPTAIDKLEVSIWKLGPGPDGSLEVAFETKNLTTGKLSLGDGVAYVNVSKSKL